MKKNIILISIFAIILFAGGCKKFLDVNHDPNYPETSTVQLVFPAGVVNCSRVLGSYSLMLGEIWSQHWTSDANAPGYMGEDSYHITSGDYNYDIGIWRSLYADAQMDFEWVRTQSKKDENWTYYLMATLMQCYTYQMLADMFEDIPMSEALKGNPPHYDLGPAVYDSLIVRIDEAMSKDLDAETCQKPAEDDLIFNGNMEDWIAFGNTLKLKIYLRQTNCKGTYSARATNAGNAIVALISSGATFLAKDVTFTAFNDEEGRDNFMYAMEFRGGNNSIRASQTIIGYLLDKSDPRIDFLFRKPTGAVHRGFWQGDFRNIYSDTINPEPVMSAPRIKSTMPFYFFTKAQVLFMLAECDARYNTSELDETLLFADAIKADVVRLNTVFAQEITEEVLVAIPETYTVSYPTTGTLEQKIEAIIVQKWIASTNVLGMEAFWDHNRTGYPREWPHKIDEEIFWVNYPKGYWTISATSVLAPPVLFPKRLLVSSTEMNRNPYAANLEVKPVNSPIWWDGAPYSYQ